MLASTDIVAADAYAATLFDLTGADIPYVQAAYDMGLGEMDLEKVRVRERARLRPRRPGSAGAAGRIPPWTLPSPPGCAARRSTRRCACTATSWPRRARSSTTATRAASSLRLTGGLAVRHYAIDLEFAEREYSDIDLIGLKRQVAEVGDVFRDLGYVENKHVAMATGNGQLQFFVPEGGAAAVRVDGALPVFTEVPPSDHIDVFLDAMRMDHQIDFRDRLEINTYAIDPADLFLSKLQIVQPQREGRPRHHHAGQGRVRGLPAAPRRAGPAPRGRGLRRPTGASTST